RASTARSPGRRPIEVYSPADTRSMVRDGALPMFTSPSDSSFHRASSPSGIRLQAVRDRLESVVDYIGDGVITIDESGLIDSVNPAAEKLFGYPAAEMLGQHINLVVTDPED